MAEFRTIQTRIWDDEWFSSLPADGKVLFLYLFTNQRASVAGIYLLPKRCISIETGLSAASTDKMLSRFARDEKAFYENGIVWVKNMRRYQDSGSPKIASRIQKDLGAIPEGPLKEQYHAYYTDTVSSDIRYPTDTVSDDCGYSIPHARDDTDTDTETDTETETRARPSAASAPTPDPHALECFRILASVKGYPSDPTTDAQLLTELEEEYPELDMLKELRAWRTYKLDVPFEAKSNPRSQLRNWMKIADKKRREDEQRGGSHARGATNSAGRPESVYAAYIRKQQAASDRDDDLCDV